MCVDRWKHNSLSFIGEGCSKVIDKGKGWVRRIYILGAGHMGGGREWARIQNLLVDEVMNWTRKGEAFCSMHEDGKVIWSYEIVEITLWER